MVTLAATLCIFEVQTPLKNYLTSNDIDDGGNSRCVYSTNFTQLLKNTHFFKKTWAYRKIDHMYLTIEQILKSLQRMNYKYNTFMDISAFKLEISNKDALKIIYIWKLIHGLKEIIVIIRKY